MTNEDRLDEIIRAAAAEYNRPPAVPREEMWQAISAEREKAAAIPRLHVSTGSVKREAKGAGGSPVRFHRHWMGLAAAAVFLVVTGVGIGRLTSDSRTPEPRVASSAEPATAAAPQPLSPVEELPSATVEPGAGSAAASGSVRGGRANEPSSARDRSIRGGRTLDEIRRDPVVRGSGELRLVTNEPTGVGSNGTGLVRASYDLATREHFLDAEALLTSFSTESASGRMDTRFAGWAKGLLSDTRLLLDSPAGDDPRRARLLQDLEATLAQIVQLSPDAPPIERELVEGTIRNGLVMTRLRAAIPADESADPMETR